MGRHVTACVPCRTPARLCSTRSVPPSPAQIRISSQHLQSGQFSGQQVRAVGKLVSHNGENVQLQLAGEGEPSDAPPPPRGAYCHVCVSAATPQLMTRLPPVGRPRGHGPLQPRQVVGGQERPGGQGLLRGRRHLASRWVHYVHDEYRNGREPRCDPRPVALGPCPIAPCSRPIVMSDNLGACSQGPVQPGTPAPCVRAPASAAWNPLCSLGTPMSDNLGACVHGPVQRGDPRPIAHPIARRPARPPARLPTRRPSLRTLALARCAAIGP